MASYGRRRRDHWPSGRYPEAEFCRCCLEVLVSLLTLVRWLSCSVARLIGSADRSRLVFGLAISFFVFQSLLEKTLDHHWLLSETGGLCLVNTPSWNAALDSSPGDDRL